MNEHDHRPGRADQRAALATARAVILGDDATAHQAASTGSCPACTVIAAASFGIALCAELAGDGPFVSQATRLRLLTAVKITQRELDTAPN